MSVRRKRAKRTRLQRTETRFVAPTTVEVAKQFKLGGEDWSDPEVDNETLLVEKFLEEPALVHVSYGLTLNLGNFESARIDVGLKVPCYKEQADDAYRVASSWAEERLQGEIAEIRKGKGR